MSALDDLTERRREAIAGRGEPLSWLERAVVYYESEDAMSELAAYKKVVWAVREFFDNMDKEGTALVSSAHLRHSLTELDKVTK